MSYTEESLTLLDYVHTNSDEDFFEQHPVKTFKGSVSLFRMDTNTYSPNTSAKEFLKVQTQQPLQLNSILECRNNRYKVIAVKNLPGTYCSIIQSTL